MRRQRGSYPKIGLSIVVHARYVLMFRLLFPSSLARVQPRPSRYPRTNLIKPQIHLSGYATQTTSPLFQLASMSQQHGTEISRTLEVMRWVQSTETRALTFNLDRSVKLDVDTLVDHADQELGLRPPWKSAGRRAQLGRLCTGSIPHWPIDCANRSRNSICGRDRLYEALHHERAGALQTGARSCWVRL